MTAPEPPRAALEETEQQRLIQQIGRSLAGSLPPRWNEALLEYRALGTHVESAALLITANGVTVPLAAPPDSEALFTRLRDGMYRPERGTWVSAAYRLRRPGSYSVDFNGELEPAWTHPPTPDQYHDELRRFPRAVQNTPAWLAPPTDPSHNGPAPHQAQTGRDNSGERALERERY
ncbi:hypothetical protein GIY23_10220 [Allosaccharopolyspora coralli]|uniref:Uncharacterized protein n=1 Tax=Allosaccharopolyspora coralli TaxID=2665642 RepID=A0A5Q3Q9G4_9PSEU|nr:hypothetical protein [Allosaccharopolyspora coralli]QGK69844.1 hypothetical protein GIY23_10220 [Allosaccharopolyspora coralli]